MRTRIQLTSNPRPVRADYTLQVDENQKRIRIVDQDLGNMSVTNDLERVLVDVAFQVDETLDNYSITYRDSTGTWDRIVVTRLADPDDTFDIVVRPGPGPDPEGRDQTVAEDADREMFGDEHVELGLENVGDK